MMNKSYGLDERGRIVPSKFWATQRRAGSIGACHQPLRPCYYHVQHDANPTPQLFSSLFNRKAILRHG